MKNNKFLLQENNDLKLENKLLREQLNKSQQPTISYGVISWKEWLKKTFFNRYFPVYFFTMAFLKGSLYFFMKQTGISPESFWLMIIKLFKTSKSYILILWQPK